MNLAFDHRTLAQRVIFSAAGAGDAAHEALSALGSQRPLIISGHSGDGLARDIGRHFPAAERISQVVQHVPAERVAEARERLSHAGSDALLSIGGGSATGLAKALARDTGLPIVAVPTTFSGSEATHTWGQTENGVKTTGVDDRVLPRTVIYDAALFASLPRSLAIVSGLNALAHAVDGQWAPRADPINTATGIEGIRTLVQGLRALAGAVAAGAERNAALEQMIYGAYQCSVAFASSGSGLHHKICHILGGAYGLPHAETHAVVLPHVAAVNLPAAPEARDRLAGALGDEDPVGALFRLQRELGAPASLRELGLSEDSAREAAHIAFDKLPPSNPGDLDAADLEALLLAAWAGDVDLGERVETTASAKAEEPEAETSGATVVSAEQSRREQELVDTVVASFSGTEDRRLQALLQSLVRHLHAFVREVRLTEDEWNAGIAFLTEAGHITTGTRQEFIMLSDVLGLSMQVIGVGNQAHKNATEATVFGPFFVEDAPGIACGDDMAFGAAGEPCWVSGTVTDTEGRPIPSARIEVWEADEDGFYDVQYGDGRQAARAHLFSDADGGYRFWGLTPTPYPIPYDGPVGRMLEAVGRSPMRASHLHFMVTAPGYRRLVTHIFVQGDEIGWDDSVFGVKESLIKDFVRHPAGAPAPEGREVRGSWSEVSFEIVLAPQGA